MKNAENIPKAHELVTLVDPPLKMQSRQADLNCPVFITVCLSGDCSIIANEYSNCSIKVLYLFILLCFYFKRKIPKLPIKQKSKLYATMHLTKSS